MSSSTSAITPGSSPRKTPEFNNQTERVAAISKRLDLVRTHTDTALWPKFWQSTPTVEIPFVGNDWLAERSFAIAANRLLDANVCTTILPLLPHFETTLQQSQGISGQRYAAVDRSLDGVAGAGIPKMDAALCFSGSNPPQSWTDIAVIVECKNCKDPTQSKARRQLKRAGERVFGHQFRLYVWGISVYSTGSGSERTGFFVIHLYTRAGILSSDPRQLEANFSLFCELLVGFARMDLGEHGWYLVLPDTNPTFLTGLFDHIRNPTTDLATRYPLHISSLPTPLRLARVLHMRNGIDSRGTVVLLCETEKGEERIVKLTWLTQHRIDRYAAILDFVRNQFTDLPKTIFCGPLSEPVAGTPTRLTTSEITKVILKTAVTPPAGWQKRGLFCVVGDRAGLTIAEEWSLERVFRACAEVVLRKSLQSSRSYSGLFDSSDKKLAKWKSGSFTTETLV
jgi:hypothetical protein